MKTILTYYYRGGIERGTSLRGRPSYRWQDGYSEDSATGTWTYPLMTKRECQQDAKRRKAIVLCQSGQEIMKHTYTMICPPKVESMISGVQHVKRFASGRTVLVNLDASETEAFIPNLPESFLDIVSAVRAKGAP